MIEQRSSSDSVITGSSTHNERIERLWRDVYRCVGVLFHDTFYELEDNGYLDCLNEVDLFCLHLVYLPRINYALQSFVESWNNHSVSTARNCTPNQLFIQGAIEYGTVPDVPNLSQLYSGPQPTSRDHVCVPRIGFMPCTSLRQQLDTIDPLAHSDDFGCTTYLQVVGLVGQHLSHGCTNCLS